MLSHVKARGERKGSQSLETRNGKGIMERLRGTKTQRGENSILRQQLKQSMIHFKQQEKKPMKS